MISDQPKWLEWSVWASILVAKGRDTAAMLAARTADDGILFYELLFDDILLQHSPTIFAGRHCSIEAHS